LLEVVAIRRKNAG
jgi:hypothetical protein